MSAPFEDVAAFDQQNAGRSNPRGSKAVFPESPADHEEGAEHSQKKIDELKNRGFTEGLAASLLGNCDVFPIRFWIVDNSYSMTSRDGHRIVHPGGDINRIQYTSCTRWEEIQDSVLYHAKMSSLLKSPTIFRLLNDPGQSVGPQQFSVAERIGNRSDGGYRDAETIMKKARPNGLTPLTEHVLEIRDQVEVMAPELVRNGQKAAIVLATDGLPTGNSGEGRKEASKKFVQSLRSLEGLPVWIVIRLCTDEDEVVSFYNDLDEQLELSLEVLDDFAAEAKEVFEFNCWLNYALPLHRIRELGFHDRVFDLIDERALTKSELRQFCVLLFGESEFDGVPDPSVDWAGFLDEVERMVRRENPVWDPLKKRVMPWIDTKQLDRLYGESRCSPGCIVM